MLGRLVRCLVHLVPHLSPSWEEIPSFRVSSGNTRTTRLTFHHCVADARSRCHTSACNRRATALFSQQIVTFWSPALGQGGSASQDWQSTWTLQQRTKLLALEVESSVSSPNLCSRFLHVSYSCPHFN